MENKYVFREIIKRIYFQMRLQNLFSPLWIYQEFEGEKKGEIHFHATVRFDRITCGTTLHCEINRNSQWFVKMRSNMGKIKEKKSPFHHLLLVLLTEIKANTFPFQNSRIFKQIITFFLFPNIHGYFLFNKVAKANK